MPELPEVETIARGLRSPLPGRSVVRTRVLKDDLVEGSARAFRAGTAGARFRAVERRGKNLVLRMERDAAGNAGGAARPRGAAREPLVLVVNLGMSGRVLLRPAGTREPEPTHPGVRFELDDGSELVYHDPRRFGRLRLLGDGDFADWSGTLGPEPLDPAFDEAAFAEALARSSSPIRSFLLDQRKVAGVGNIYANEALFLAGIHPALPARRISREGARRLHEALRTVLREAIRARGTTLRDYRTAQGWEGGYAGKLRVYGREGEPCPACGATVRRIVFGGRSAFLCPECQPRRGT